MPERLEQDAPPSEGVVGPGLDAADLPPELAPARSSPTADTLRAVLVGRLPLLALLQGLVATAAAALVAPSSGLLAPVVLIGGELALAGGFLLLGRAWWRWGLAERATGRIGTGLLAAAALLEGLPLWHLVDTALPFAGAAIVAGAAAGRVALLAPLAPASLAVVVPGLVPLGAVLALGDAALRPFGGALLLVAALLLGGSWWARRLYLAAAQLQAENAALRSRLDERERRLAFAATASAAADRARSSFFDMMSHELRTPLNAILGFSDPVTAQAFAHDPEKLAEHREIINRSGRHLLALINDILDLSKIDTGRFELRRDYLYACDLAASCTAIVNELATMRGVTLTVEIVEPPPRIWADERATKQMLINLLSNACKFTARGGIVRLQFLPAEGGAVMVRVVDTGVGMDARAIAAAVGGLEALARFDSTSDAAPVRRRRRAGFGLPLVAALIDLHGGSLEIDSAPGRGTTVCLTFPPPALPAAA